MSSVIQNSPPGVPRRGVDSTWLPVYVALGVLVLLFVPLLAVGFLMLMALGLIVIRSAVVHRQTGWPSGLLFGLMLVSPAAVAIASLIVRLVRG